MEEALADLEEHAAADTELAEERQQNRQERDDSATQKRQDAKQLIDKLKQFVTNNGCQWQLGRSKITRAHLDAVFLAFGKPKQTGKMQDLVQQAQEMLKWDAGTGIFSGVLGWDDDSKHWVVLSQ